MFSIYSTFNTLYFSIQYTTLWILGVGDEMIKDFLFLKRFTCGIWEPVSDNFLRSLWDAIKNKCTGRQPIQMAILLTSNDILLRIKCIQMTF
jgi:hypothetical protein